MGAAVVFEMNEPIHIISLGAGVQSSTMALMAAHGEITPMPACAIFADTQAEPSAVYKWLDWLEKQLPFPVHRVSAGNLREKSLRIVRSKKSGRLYMKRYIPAFVLKPDGSKGLMGRTCTMDFKIVPLIRKARTLCDWKRGEKRQLVTMWIGISRDEAHRMKPSRELWIENRWPLIEIEMTRQGCLKWMKANGYPEPPRSACTFCPFHSDEEWLRLSPAELAGAVQYERELITAAANQNALTGIPYLHNSCQPLDTVQFKRYERPGMTQTSLFGNECEGMCGV